MVESKIKRFFNFIKEKTTNISLNMQEIKKDKKVKEFRTIEETEPKIKFNNLLQEEKEKIDNHNNIIEKDKKIEENEKETDFNININEVFEINSNPNPKFKTSPMSNSKEEAIKNLTDSFIIEETSLDYTTKKNQINFILEKKNTHLKYYAVIKLFQNGIFQFEVVSNKKKLSKNLNNFNNFPQMESSSFSGIKFSKKKNYFEVYLNNKVLLNKKDSSEKEINDLLDYKFLGSTIFDEISLRIYFKPFKIEFFNHGSFDLGNDLNSVEMNSSLMNSSLTIINSIYINSNSSFCSIKNKKEYTSIKLIELSIIEIDSVVAFKTRHFQTSNCYGIPERMNKAKLKDGEYRLFNADKAFHKPESCENLYGSIPLIYSQHYEFFSGVLINNPSEGIVEIKTDNELKNEKEIIWLFNSGNTSMYLFSDEKSKIFYKNALITGFPLLPPLFSLGYHHSRYGFEGIDDVVSTLIGFDDNNIPLDVMWLDIEHTNNKKYFTWNKKWDLDKIKSFIQLLKTNNRYLVTIADPHICTSKDDYNLCKKLLENDLMIKNLKNKKFNTNFIGEC